MKREELLQLYKEERDPNIKDRPMLIIKAKFDGRQHHQGSRLLWDGSLLREQMIQPPCQGWREGAAQPA